MKTIKRAVSAMLMLSALSSRGQTVTDVNSWELVFSDPGQNGSVSQYWSVWGKPGAAARTSAGMRVTGGPDINNDSDRSLLWAKAALPSGDLKISYKYTRHDSACTACASARVGIASMLLISTDGTGSIPLDPTSVTVAAPSLSLINSNTNGIRLTYSTTYHPDATVLDQVRAHLNPGNTDLPPKSSNDFQFNVGSTYEVTWTKARDTITIQVKDPSGTTRTHTFSHPNAALKQGQRVAIYQQPIRDATYKDFKIWVRKGR